MIFRHHADAVRTLGEENLWLNKFVTDPRLLHVNLVRNGAMSLFLDHINRFSADTLFSYLSPYMRIDMSPVIGNMTTGTR